jgi:hypothetical protein
MGTKRLENFDLIEHAEVIHKGDDSGNEMTVRWRLPSGLEIFGLPTKNAYGGHWNHINLESRVNELLQHHIERCGAIIAILNTGPKTAEEIAAEHFEERLLEGFGNIMAANEIVSHCELLIESEDVVAVDGNGYAATGSMQFETFIKNLTWD